MSRKGYIGLGLGLIVVILVAAAGLVLTNNKTLETLSFEKGAQLTQVPAPVTPLPTGPTEPTMPPTSSPVSQARPTATPPPTSALATQPTQSAAPVATRPALTPTPTPRPANYIIPAKIKIPAINIDTFVERVGVTKDGNMDVPKNIWNTGWFGDGGYRPGDQGNAVIAGHLDAPGTVAVFWNLDKLKAGDKIILNDQAGKQLTFEVFDKQVYPYNNAPLQTIFGPSTEPRLNLITCGGTFDRSSQIYNKRLVVYTRLVSAT
jgi:LPXTG-site transpeptidase (sortase) family protein